MSQVVRRGGGNGEKFLLEISPICFGELSVGADWHLNGVGGNGDNDRGPGVKSILGNIRELGQVEGELGSL